ncbi:Cysteine and histidine-rich domain-containing protein 1, partial [Fasciolopsis buskii]
CSLYQVSESTHVVPKSIPPPIPPPQARRVPTEPMKQLRVEIAPSLKSMLEKMSITNGPQNTHTTEQDGDKIILGTTCKNSGCKSTFTGSDSDSELCLYHPGVPIFHEGMKFWTCCNRKTSEFEAFMEQQGCTTGRHNWTEKVNFHKTSNVCILLHQL